MKTSFFQQIQQFSSLVEGLQKDGLKQKEIAQHVGLHASALSSLVKGIFPSILAYGEKARDLPQHISTIFDRYNNVSERRIRQQIEDYNHRLQQVVEEVQVQGVQTLRPFVGELVQESPGEVLSKLQGIYECYYVSSFGYRVKCEPFMMVRKKGETHLTAQKGNQRGPAAYAGFVYISNNHVLTIQLQEAETINKDHFMIHFILPPAYQGSLDLLRGIAVSISNAYFPIARKIILRRVQTHTDRQYYEQMETRFYEEGQGEEDPIIAYLRAGHSLMEYIPIPHPTFDDADLSKELAVREVLKQDH